MCMPVLTVHVLGVPVGVLACCATGVGICLHRNSHAYLSSPIPIPKDGPARPSWLGWRAGEVSMMTPLMPTGNLRWQKD